MIGPAAKCSPRLSKRGLKKNDPSVNGIKDGIPRVDFEQQPAEGESQSSGDMARNMLFFILFSP
jgi:hypothetical protein